MRECHSVWYTTDPSLEAITLREQSLNLFHALGKVFYNKRMCLWVAEGC